MMLLRFIVAPLLVLPLFAGGVSAGGLPLIKTTNSNVVPACATPGRLMALLKDRNPQMNARYANIAGLYKMHGTALGVRWDYAFFQMIVETGGLKFRRGNGQPSDVRPKQNNFAGLGATGNGVHGEAFDNISDGVKAHLQHLQLYAGVHVKDPVAERTRKVQAWGIYEKWHKRLRRKITFRHMARKWAPGSKGYSRDIASVGAKFYKSYCKRPDPDPGSDLVAKAPVLDGKSALGARNALRTPARNSGTTKQTSSSKNPGLTVINPVAARSTESPTAVVVNENTDRNSIALPMRKPVKLAAAARASAKRSSPQAKRTRHKRCRVWTASYGGQKAVLIKSETKEFTNYTVLDVHKGKEKREATAYIAAYAQGGRKLADFSTQTQALNKAFKLCPEG